MSDFIKRTFHFVKRTPLTAAILLSTGLSVTYCSRADQAGTEPGPAVGTQKSAAAGALALTADANFFPAGALSSLSSTDAVTQIYSDNGAYTLTLQPGGNLVETNYQKGVWQSFSDGKGASTAAMQNDGNLVVYQTSTGYPTFNTATSNSGVAPYALTLQNDGNLVIYDSRNVEVWSNHVGDSSLDVPVVSQKATVSSSNTLTTLLKSPNLLYSFTMQGDGNLVLYKQGQAIWNTATYGRGYGPFRAVMQNDGNFVVYDSRNSALWSTGTYGQGVAPYQLVLNNFGDVYVKDSLGHRLWSALGTPGTVYLTGAAWSPPVPSVIKNYHAQGKCFDAASSYNGVQAHLWDCNGGNYNQSLLYTLDQQLQIATDTSRCLTYETNTAAVDTQPCTGATTQKWVISAADGAYGTIQPLKNSGLCLDTDYVGTSDGTPIDIYNCTGGDGQQWSKSPIGNGVFNPSLPWWPNSSYTDSNTQNAQRAAWQQVVTNLNTAINAGLKTYTIPAGIYRTGGVAAYFTNTNNFTLNAAGVELIGDNNDVGFYLYGNTNFVLNGPMIFDSTSGGGNSQGTINYTDASTYVEFSLSNGSPLPASAGNRIMLFDQNGQIESQDIYTYGTINGGGGQYTLSNFGRSTYGAEYGEFGGSNVALGNYIATTGTAASTFMQTYKDTSIVINDVALYSGGLFVSPVNNPTGKITLNRVTSPRRPGTSRLMGGGIGFFGQLTTGSISIFESEAAWSTDDDTDPFSVIIFGASDVQSNTYGNQIRASGWGCPASSGDTINIYDPNTLQLLFSDKLASCVPSNNEYLLTFQTHNPPTLQPGCIIDDATAQGTVIYADSYFHDALSNGMQSQGGKYVSFTNNYVHNAAVSVTGFNANFPSEGGGVPIDVVINNNTMNRQMLYQNPIVINLQLGYPTASPIHSATVLNNLMMTWQNSGPLVTQVQSTNISGNVITSSLPSF